MPAFNPTPALDAFLKAEVRNEDDGGVSPTTLASARDSLDQMPEDVVETINAEAEASGAHKASLLAEIDRHIVTMGRRFQPERHLSW